MKTRDLIEKMMVDVAYARDIQALTKLAFLVNLLYEMDSDIPEKAIQNAHASMLYPSSRAVISTCFGHKDVRVDGLPESYYNETQTK